MTATHAYRYANTSCLMGMYNKKPKLQIPQMHLIKQTNL